jgi:hypothetical protein
MSKVITPASGMRCCWLWSGTASTTRVLDLVGQYLRRTVDENCLNTTVTVVISLGCPLSPVMAAIYLELLDRRAAASNRRSTCA